MVMTNDSDELTRHEVHELEAWYYICYRTLHALDNHNKRPRVRILLVATASCQRPIRFIVLNKRTRLRAVWLMPRKQCCRAGEIRGPHFQWNAVP